VSAFVPRRSAALLFLLLGAARLGAQTAPAPAATALPAATTAQAAPAGDALPKLEQGKAENPVSRFEIVSLGSYPITLFYVDFAFDFQSWLAHGRDANYAPWPVKGVFSSSLTDSQRLTRLGAALGVAFAVGAVDAIIHAKKVKAAERLRESRLLIDPSGAAP
jgi:hypothetical protein